MKLIRWERFAQITAFTTTRLDGVSKTPFSSLNLAYHVGDESHDVTMNRHLVCNELGVDINHLIVPKQIHSDIIMKVTKDHLGCGAYDFDSGVGPADALYTYDKDLALGVFHADCVPLFIYAPKHKMVGIIHAGMEGTIKMVTFKAIEHLKNIEGINPLDIYVRLGPSISCFHYEINESLKNRILTLEPSYHRALKVTSGKIYLDIPLLNVIELRKAGIPSENIDIEKLCTFENEQLFFSYRYAHTTGRQLSIIKLK